MVPILAGIIVAVIVAIVLALLLIFFLLRRKKKQHAGKYRENSNVSPAHTAPTTTTIPGAPLVLNAQAPVYDVASGRVAFNRDIAFENPGYATQQEMAAMGPEGVLPGPDPLQAGPLPAKTADSDDEYDDLDLKSPPLGGSTKGGFGNPLYANGKALRDDNPYESLPDLKK